MWDLTVSVPDHCLSFYFGGLPSFDLELWSNSETTSNFDIMFQPHGTP